MAKMVRRCWRPGPICWRSSAPCSMHRIPGERRRAFNGSSSNHPTHPAIEPAESSPMSQSQELFEQARRYIPGGVNSPVRAFKGVGGDPVFIKRAEGPYLVDEDDRRYVDYVGSWGPMVLG